MDCIVTHKGRVFYKEDFVHLLLDTIGLSDKVVEESAYLQSIGYKNKFERADVLKIRKPVPRETESIVKEINRLPLSRVEGLAMGSNLIAGSVLEGDKLKPNPSPKEKTAPTPEDKLKEAFNKWKEGEGKLGAIFDPKSQAERDIEFLKAILSYAKEKAITTYENFKKALKEFGVYDESKDEDWKEVFGGTKAEPDKVEKKVLGRAFRGSTDESRKAAIEKFGLYRTPESQDKALDKGRELVEELGVEGALDVARNESDKLNGMTVAAIYGAAIEDVYKRSLEAETIEEQIDLINQQAAIMNELSGTGTKAGQLIGMLPKIYESGDVPYDYEAKLSEYEKAYGEATEATKKAFKEAQDKLDEVNKKLVEANKKLRETEGKDAVAGIKEAGEREKKQTTPKSALKQAANFFRGLKLHGKGIFSSATPASLVWDGAMETVATALDAGATIEAAIKKGLAHIKNSDWYKGLSQSKQSEAEEAFNKETAAAKAQGAEIIDGNVKIPHSLMRYYVEQGMTDIDEIAKAIQKDLGDEVTVRQIRDAITNYGKKVNPTKNEVNDKIAELKRIGKKISLLEDLQRKIAKEKNTKTKAEYSEQEKQLQKEIDAFSKKEFGEKTPLDKYKDRTRKQIEELNKKLQNKDFSAKVKTAQTEFDDEAMKLYGERERAKDQFDYEFEKAMLAERTRLQKIEDGFLDVMGLTKSLKASFDMSAPFRQGIINLFSQNPIKSGKDFKFMFQSVADLYRNKAKGEDLYHKWLNELKGSKDWPLMKESGLFIAQEDPKMQAREEAFATNLIREIPFVERPVKVFGKTIPGAKLGTASEIAYNAFLNHQRAVAFRDGVQVLKDAGKSFKSHPEEYKSLANYINVATGRADLKKVGPGALKWLNATLFSPRFMGARLQYINPFKYLFMPPTARKMALIRDAKFLTTVAVLVGLMALRLRGDDDDETDIELDPRSPDFLKGQIYGTKFDIFGGISSYFNTVAQIVTGERKNRKTEEVEELGKKFGSKDETKIALDFVLGKLAPVPSAFLSWKLAQRNEDGKLINPYGEEVTLKNTAIDLIAPLYLSDAKEIWSNHEVPTAAALSVAAFFGAGVNANKPRELTDKQKTSAIAHPDKEQKEKAKELIEKAYENSDTNQLKKGLKMLAGLKRPEEVRDLFVDLTQKKAASEFGTDYNAVKVALMGYPPSSDGTEPTKEVAKMRSDRVKKVEEKYKEVWEGQKEKFESFADKQIEEAKLLDQVSDGKYSFEQKMRHFWNK